MRGNTFYVTQILQWHIIKLIDINGSIDQLATRAWSLIKKKRVLPAFLMLGIIGYSQN